jgi:uncharacterized protein YjbJ (UPF0337 family)
MCRRRPALRRAYQRLIIRSRQAGSGTHRRNLALEYYANGGFVMGSTADKIKGAVDTAVGKAKEKAGYVIGSDKLQAKGAAQAVKGKVETGVGKAKSGFKSGLKKGIDRI